jgi:hypothetical protein
VMTDVVSEIFASVWFLRFSQTWNFVYR